MLKHTTRKLVNAPIIYCLRCVRDPGNFLSHSKYTYTVKRIRDNVYEVVFLFWIFRYISCTGSNLNTHA